MDRAVVCFYSKQTPPGPIKAFAIPRPQRTTHRKSPIRMIGVRHAAPGNATPAPNPIGEFLPSLARQHIDGLKGARCNVAMKPFPHKRSQDENGRMTFAKTKVWQEIDREKEGRSAPTIGSRDHVRSRILAIADKARRPERARPPRSIAPN